MNRESDMMFDILIVGGGIVGCAVFRQLVLSGYGCALIEKNPHVVQGASRGNSGIACTGFDAPNGSIERKCIRKGMSLNPIVYTDLSLPSKKVGSLIVAWTQEQVSKLSAIVQENHSIGDKNVRLIEPEELYCLEPNLSVGALGGVLIPGEVIVEPWLIPIAFLHHAILNGGKLYLNHKVISGKITKEKNWNLCCANRVNIEGRVVINCAGNFGDVVEQIHEPNPPFKILPRKGQFVVFERTSDAKPILTRPIQPVPTEETKGIIIFRTLYGNIVVGPTATESKLERENPTTDGGTLSKLLEYGYSIIPELKNLKIIGNYAGLRPATQFRDYQINLDEKKNWITVGGIRSTGLTACLGIAEYVHELVDKTGLKAKQKLKNTKSFKMPSLEELALIFLQRNDGSVLINGLVHQVDHPITIFGWKN